jgi:hypothetical protein
LNFDDTANKKTEGQYQDGKIKYVNKEQHTKPKQQRIISTISEDNSVNLIFC